MIYPGILSAFRKLDFININENKISGIYSLKIIFLIILISLAALSHFNYAEEGYELWLKYKLVSDKHQLEEYRDLIKGVIIRESSLTIQITANELNRGLNGLLGLKIPEINGVDRNGALSAGTYGNFPLLKNIDLQDKIIKAGDEEFNSEQMLLKLQYENAVKWRDGCVLYFQTFSKLPIPSGLPAPEHDLEYYEAHNPK